MEVVWHEAEGIAIDLCGDKNLAQMIEEEAIVFPLFEELPSLYTARDDVVAKPLYLKAWLSWHGTSIASILKQCNITSNVPLTYLTYQRPLDLRPLDP